MHHSIMYKYKVLRDPSELSPPHSVTAFIYLHMDLSSSLSTHVVALYTLIIDFFLEKILSEPVAPLHSLSVTRHPSCME